MRSEGYCSCSLCVRVYLSVCLSTIILELHMVRQLFSDTNGFSIKSNVAILAKTALPKSKKLETGTVMDCVMWSSPSISDVHAYS